MTTTGRREHDTETREPEAVVLAVGSDGFAEFAADTMLAAWRRKIDAADDQESS